MPTINREIKRSLNGWCQKQCRSGRKQDLDDEYHGDNAEFAEMAANMGP